MNSDIRSVPDPKCLYVQWCKQIVSNLRTKSRFRHVSQPVAAVFEGGQGHFWWGKMTNLEGSCLRYYTYRKNDGCPTFFVGGEQIWGQLPQAPVDIRACSDLDRNNIGMAFSVDLPVERRQVRAGWTPTL